MNPVAPNPGLEPALARLDALVARRPVLRPLGIVAVGALMLVPAFAPEATIIVFLGVCAVALVAASRRDEGTVIVLLAGLTFLVPANHVVKPLGQVGSPAILAASLMFVLWVGTRVVPDAGGDRGRQPLRLLVAASFAIVLAGYLAGQLRGLTPVEASGADAAVISQLSSMGLLLFVADGIRSTAGVRRTLRLVVAGGAVLSLVGVLQFFAVVDLAERFSLPGLTRVVTEDVSSLERSGFLRIMGFAGHPIEFGVVLGMVLPIALHVALHAPATRRLLAWSAVAVIAAGLPMAVSRSAVLTAAVALGVYVVVVRLRVLVNLLPLALVGLVAMQAAAPGLLGSLRSLFAFGNVAADPSIAGRTADYEAVEGLWLAHPLFGIGPGTYIPSLYRILDNQYLYSLITNGLFGLAAIIALFAVGYSLARRVRRYSPDPEARDMGQAMAGAIAGAAVASVTFDAFGFLMMFVLTHLLIGAAGALWRLEVRDRRPVRGEEAGDAGTAPRAA